jgi:hypothetical protein
VLRRDAMLQKDKPEDAGKRTKKPGKIADLPAKSLKTKDAANVKGGGRKVPLARAQ